MDEFAMDVWSMYKRQLGRRKAWPYMAEQITAGWWHLKYGDIFTGSQMLNDLYYAGKKCGWTR